MKAWWDTMQLRERLMLVLGAAALLIVLGYLMVWEPLAERRAELSDRVAVERETLLWMQGASREVRRLRQTVSTPAPIDDDRSLLALVDASAEQSGLRNAIQRMQPEGSNGVSLWLENAPFDALIGWLGTLKSRYGIRAKSIAVERSDTAGRVDIHVSLQRR